MTRAANLFRRLGIGPGDAVAYVLPNGLEAPLALLAGATAGIVLPINPLLVARAYRRHPARHPAQGGGDAGAVPEDRRGRRRSPRRWRWRPAVETVLEVDLARYLAPPLAWIVPLIRPKLEAAAPGAGARPAPAMARENAGRARLRGDARRPGLRLLPHRRHHRAAEGGAAPGERHPLQRLVRAVLHLHRGGRADVPAADVPCAGGLSDPDVLPDDRGRRWSCRRRRAIAARG